MTTTSQTHGDPVRLVANAPSQPFRDASHTTQNVSFRDLVGPLPSDELTHSVFPYPARLLRQIPRLLLAQKEITDGIEQIVDPFCGSGTVLLEAKTAGFPSIGFDQNPIAVLVSRVKTSNIAVDSFATSASRTLELARRTRKKQEPRAHVRRWYEDDVHSALARLAYAVHKQVESDTDALKLALILTARKVANTDPRIPVPVSPREAVQYRSRDVWATWEKECAKLARRLATLDPALPEARVVHGDARETMTWAEVRDDAKSLIFTSPPYGAAQKYIRSTSLDLGWLRLSDEYGTVRLERDSIGREHLSSADVQNAKEPLNLPEIDRLTHAAREHSPARADIYATYFRDMTTVLGHMGQKAARVVLVSGTNRLAQSEILTYRHLGDILQSLGFERTMSFKDQIRGRALLTKRRGASEPSRAEYVEVFNRG